MSSISLGTLLIVWTRTMRRRTIILPSCPLSLDQRNHRSGSSTKSSPLTSRTRPRRKSRTNLEVGMPIRLRQCDCALLFHCLREHKLSRDCNRISYYEKTRQIKSPQQQVQQKGKESDMVVPGTKQLARKTSLYCYQTDHRITT